MDSQPSKEQFAFEQKKNSLVIIEMTTYFHIHHVVVQKSLALFLIKYIAYFRKLCVSFLV